MMRNMLQSLIQNICMLSFLKITDVTVELLCVENMMKRISSTWSTIIRFFAAQESPLRKVIVEKHADKESYAGACDDLRIGVTMIFYLQNCTEYVSEMQKNNFDQNHMPLTLSGLAKEGKILLPVKKDQKQVAKEKELAKNRSTLIAAARNGDEAAMENLTMDDIDTYSMISRRIVKEDVFTIVDSYFMPYGIECDKYNVMGEIIDCVDFRNILTGEKIYQMTIECNDMQFDICINESDLLGEPKVGRRFKGIIWLQGQIQFCSYA